MTRFLVAALCGLLAGLAGWWVDTYYVVRPAKRPSVHRVYEVPRYTPEWAAQGEDEEQRP